MVGVVDLPEGVSVRCNLIDVEPDPEAIRFGMPVEMTTGVSQQDKQGNDVVAFYFRPVQDGLKEGARWLQTSTSSASA